MKRLARIRRPAESFLMQTSISVAESSMVKAGFFKLSVRACIVACLLITTGVLTAHDPHDPIVLTTVSPNYAQDHTVFAAAGGLSLKIGVYLLLKSNDGGVNWTVVAGLPNNSEIAAIV